MSTLKEITGLANAKWGIQVAVACFGYFAGKALYVLACRDPEGLNQALATIGTAIAEYFKKGSVIVRIEGNKEDTEEYVRGFDTKKAMKVAENLVVFVKKHFPQLENIRFEVKLLSENSFIALEDKLSDEELQFLAQAEGLVTKDLPKQLEVSDKIEARFKWLVDDLREAIREKNAKDLKERFVVGGPSGNLVPKKTLRVALSMGGGVSLGAFSGAALTEALKLLLLFARDRDGAPYKRLEIDVFSGASAGSMCLLVMLRYLALSPVSWDLISEAWNNRYELEEKYYPNVAPEEPGFFSKIGGTVSSWLGKRDKQEEIDEEKEMVNRAVAGLFHGFTNNNTVIEDLYESALNNEDDQLKFTQLVAIQVLQDKQCDIWTSITLDELLDGGGKGGGIFNQKRLEDIVKDHLQGLFKKKDKIGVDRQILADRVAFASTLSSLSASQFDSRASFNVSEVMMDSAADGLTSLTHRTERVFDLSFKPLEEDDRELIRRFRMAREESFLQQGVEYPTDNFAQSFTMKEREKLLQFPMCWIRAEPDKSGDAGFDIHSEKLWAKMACTSLASGAFPVAFPPVPMTRSWWEYGVDKWVKDVGASPKYLQKEFAFVDGGLLDNEPLRQAFRMASVFDSISHVKDWESRTGTPDFERIVLFVDPRISKGQETEDMELPKESDWLLSSLKKVASGVATMIMDEASTVEANIVDAFSHVLQHREKFKDYIKVAGDDNPLLAGKEFVGSLQLFLNKILKRFVEKNWSHLDVATTGIDGDVLRVLWQMYPGQPDVVFGVMEELQILKALNEKMEEEKRRRKGLKNELPEVEWPPTTAISNENYRRLSAALMLVAIDQLMDKEGASRNSVLVAIGPYKYGPGEKKKQVEMPASQLRGFGGIISKTAAIQATQAGIYCARDMLHMNSNANKNRTRKQWKRFQDRILRGEFPSEKGTENPDPTTLTELQEKQIASDFEEANGKLRWFASKKLFGYAVAAPFYGLYKAFIEKDSIVQYEPIATLEEQRQKETKKRNNKKLSVTYIGDDNNSHQFQLKITKDARGNVVYSTEGKPEQIRLNDNDIARVGALIKPCIISKNNKREYVSDTLEYSILRRFNE